MQVAKNEIARAKELGYASNPPEYAALNLISALEKQLKSNGNTESVFAKLKDDIASFLKNESGLARQ